MTGGPDILGDRLSPSWRGRLVGKLTSRLPRARHPAVGRALALLVVSGLCLGAAVYALAPPGVRAAEPPRLVPVSITVPPAGPPGAPIPEVVATYRTTSRASGARVTVTGVTGPLVGTSAARRVSAPGGEVTFRVRVRPACRGVGGLDTTGPRYVVAVTRTDAVGRSTRSHLRLPRTAPDWGAALRQVCWQQRATLGIDITRLRTGLDRRLRQLLITASLRSLLPDDVRIGVIDVADVSTLARSDSGILRAGSHRDFRIRWPVASCAAPALPQHTFAPTSRTAGQVRPALEWSVGPTGTDPAALFVTPLSSGQVALLRAAMDRLCRLPRTT